MKFEDDPLRERSLFENNCSRIVKFKKKNNFSEKKTKNNEDHLFLSQTPAVSLLDKLKTWSISRQCFHFITT